MGPSILGQLPCIRDLFDVYEDDGKQIVMKYKRVFNEEEAQGNLIREMQQRKYDTQEIVNALIRNYDMTSIRANDRISRYEIEHQARSLFFSPNKEYSFPLEITINPQQIRVDMFKYCRDCGRLPKEEEQEYVVGPKGRIHQRFNKQKIRTEFELPDFSYYALFQMYVSSLLDVINRPDVYDQFTAKCVGRRGEAPTTTQGILETSPTSTAPPPTMIESIPQIDMEMEEDEDEDIMPDTEPEKEPIYQEPEQIIVDEETSAQEEQEGEEEEEEDEEEEEEEEMFYMKKRGGTHITKAKKDTKVTKLSVLQQKEPAMFGFKDERIGTYSRICQKEKQPVILDKEDYESALVSNPDMKAIHYKNPLAVHSQKYWYTCPKYWCSLTNSVITEQEYQSGVCADHVVTNPRYLNPSFLSTDKHPDGLCLPCCFEGDIENKPMHRNRIKDCQTTTVAEEEPTSAAPESIKESIQAAIAATPLSIPHPQIQPIATPSTTVPASIAPKLAVSATPLKSPIPTTKEDRNILRYTQNPPITNGRWGLLPRIMELFFNLDYSKVIVRTPLKTNVEPNKPTLLLYGIEHPKRQSFLGLYAEITRQHSQSYMTMQEFREKMVRSITLDRFLQMHNGSLISVFSKSDSTEESPIETPPPSILSKYLDMNDPTHQAFYQRVIRAYSNFLSYLADPTTLIDHTYLWELIATDPENPLNLIIFEMTEDNKVDVLCPLTTNSIFDPKKETMFVLKRDNFYEPIYQFYDQDGAKLQIRRIFRISQDFMPNSSIRRIMDIVQSTITQNCRPVALQEATEGGVKPNHDATKLKSILDKSGYSILNQVWNLNGKLIGYYVKKQGTSTVELYVPCFPSAPILGGNEPTIKFIGDKTIPKSYKETWKAIQLLLQDSDHEILIEPIHKIVDADIVRGISTETGQTIPVLDTPVDEVTDQLFDLPSVEQSDEIAADRTIVTSTKGDTTRITKMRNIILETQFYQVFRSLLRQLLNNFGNLRQKRSILERIKQYERNQSSEYEDALKNIAVNLYEISQEYVDFVEYNDQQLDQIHQNDLYGCYQERGGAATPGQSIYCRGSTLVIPKYSLLQDTACGENGADCSNKNIYYMRLADELLRFRRIQLFMFQRQTFLNISSGMNEYHLGSKEILLLESSFTDDYFKDMIPFNVSSYIHQTNYDTAIPYEIMSNMDLYQPAFNLKEQEQFVRQIRPEVKSRMEMTECIVQTEGGRHPVMGNNRSSWYRSFPKGTEEYFFRDESPECTFGVVANALRLVDRPRMTIQEIKADLWRGYQLYMAVPGNQSKIMTILRDQNKRTVADLETTIMTDDYYLTDLDIWVLMSYWKLPSVLFSSGRIKMADADNWLYMNGDEPESLYEPLVFIRSPRMVESGKYPAYSIIVPRYKTNEVGEMGRAMEESPEGSNNKRSLITLLDNMQLVTLKRRGRPAMNS
jgi:hypothetical protein